MKISPVAEVYKQVSTSMTERRAGYGQSKLLLLVLSCIGPLEIVNHECFNPLFVSYISKNFSPIRRT